MQSLPHPPGAGYRSEPDAKSRPASCVVRDTCNVYVIRHGPRRGARSTSAAASSLDRLGELGVDRITDVLADAPPPRPGAGARARGRGGHPDLGAAGRAGARRRRRPRTGSARRVDERLRPAPGPLLAARAGAGRGHRRRVPDARATAASSVYDAADAGAHDRLGHLPRRASRRLHRRPRLRRRQGLVARGDAVDVQRASRGRWRRSSRAGVLARREPRLLLPSHGEPIAEPAEALARCCARGCRSWPTCDSSSRTTSRRWEREPWVARDAAPAAQPHELRELLRAALRDRARRSLIDWGYDLATGVDWLGPDRSGRRPLLDVARALGDPGRSGGGHALPRRPRGRRQPASRRRAARRSGRPRTSRRCSSSPSATTCPASGTSRSPVDRVLPLGEPLRWHEYELTAHALPGHTLLRGRHRVRGRRPPRRSRRATSRATGRRPRDPQLPVPKPLPRSTTTSRAPSSTGACGPTSSSPATGGARGGDELPRPTRSPTAAGWPSCTASCCRSTRSTSAPEGFARADRAVPVDRLGVAATLDLDVTVRNPFPREAAAECRSSCPHGWTARAGRTGARARRARRGDAPFPSPPARAVRSRARSPPT